MAGRLALLLDTEGPIEVTLRQPPPLDTEMRIALDDSVLSAFHNDLLVAEARPVADEIAVVPPVDFDTAVDAATRFAGFVNHPFPTCVVCGTDRTDGLACYAGPIDPEVPQSLATPFVAREDLPRDRTLTWAALDCAGGWAIGLEGRRAVLGRMTALITEVPEVAERCVVVARCDQWQGRKAISRSTGYGEDGRVLGVAMTTWIELR